MQFPKPITFGTDGRFHVDDTTFADIKFLKPQEAVLNTLTTVGQEVGWMGRLSDGKTHCLAVNYEQFLLSPGGTLTQVHDQWEDTAIPVANLHVGNRVRLTVLGQPAHAVCVKLWRNGRGADLRVVGTGLTCKRSFDRMDEVGVTIIQLAPETI